MNEKIYSIGEIAKIKGVTKKALRFYEQIGLLTPFYVDPANRYRYYHKDQMLLIDVIKASRNLDISPIDLVPLFKSHDTDGLINLLQTQGEAINKKIGELQDVLTGIENINSNIHNAKVSASISNVYQKEIPERYVITIPFHQYDNPDEILNDYSKLDILVNQLNGIATYEAGILFDLCEGEAIPSYIFTTIAKPVSHQSCQHIMKGNYICINYAKENAITCQEELIRYILKNNLTPKGIVQVELLTSLFHSDELKCELQICI